MPFLPFLVYILSFLAIIFGVALFLTALTNGSLWFLVGIGLALCGFIGVDLL